MSLCTTIRQCMDSSTGTEPCAISVRHVDLERDARLRGRRQRGGHLLQHHPPLGERAARTTLCGHLGTAFQILVAVNGFIVLALHANLPAMVAGTSSRGKDAWQRARTGYATQLKLPAR